uniref:Uncharacterized protein n=1 Tax=Anguilla anguilla TaxID=7936 RepID=A0A0E9QGM0_ANGAN
MSTLHISKCARLLFNLVRNCLTVFIIIVNPLCIGNH